MSLANCLSAYKNIFQRFATFMLFHCTWDGKTSLHVLRKFLEKCRNRQQQPPPPTCCWSFNILNLLFINWCWFIVLYHIEMELTDRGTMQFEWVFISFYLIYFLRNIYFSNGYASFKKTWNIKVYFYFYNPHRRVQIQKVIVKKPVTII